MYSGHIEKAKKVFLGIYESNPNDTWAAYNMACLYSLQKNIETALDWFEKSMGKDIPFIHIINDPDLDYIKNTPEFKRIMKQYYPEKVMQPKQRGFRYEVVGVQNVKTQEP